MMMRERGQDLETTPDQKVMNDTDAEEEKAKMMWKREHKMPSNVDDQVVLDRMER
jgi:hypothetical protein